MNKSIATAVLAFALLLVNSESAAAPKPASASVAVVVHLYRDFAWEAVVEEPTSSGPGLLDQPRQVLAQYFDNNLVSLILKDRACTARTEGVCNLEFMPIWASQDPGATQLKVLPTIDPSVVSVKFRYPSTNELIELTYRLSKTRSGWRVRDIDYSSGPSLLNILEAKL